MHGAWHSLSILTLVVAARLLGLPLALWGHSGTLCAQSRRVGTVYQYNASFIDEEWHPGLARLLLAVPWPYTCHCHCSGCIVCRIRAPWSSSWCRQCLSLTVSNHRWYAVLAVAGRSVLHPTIASCPHCPCCPTMASQPLHLHPLHLRRTGPPPHRQACWQCRPIGPWCSSIGRHARRLSLQ